MTLQIQTAHPGWGDSSRDGRKKTTVLGELILKTQSDSGKLFPTVKVKLGFENRRTLKCADCNSEEITRAATAC